MEGTWFFLAPTNSGANFGVILPFSAFLSQNNKLNIKSIDHFLDIEATSRSANNEPGTVSLL